MRNYIIFTALAIILAFIQTAKLDAQILDSAALVSAKLYMNLNEAFNEPEKVHKLCMGGHELKEFPQGLEVFKNLQEINISQNYLESIPESFCSLQNLEELKIGTNELKKLPENISKMTSLKRLDLSVNPKINWRTELIKLTALVNLVTLDISYNDIGSIPEDFSRLKNLSELNLSGNKLSREEKEKVKKMLPNTKIAFDDF